MVMEVDVGVIRRWIAISISAACALGAAASDDSAVTTVKLTEGLYLLSTDQGEYTTNTVASVGPDGVLLVDTQSEGDAEDLKKAVDAFGKGPPKFIINTHRHVEHVGGNAAFGEAPVIIAHELVPQKLRSGSYLFNEFPEATFPDITFSDRLTVRFNGEVIELTAMPGSHDDNEIIVHFTRAKVVHLSSLANGFNFPSVDADGDTLMFAPLVEKAIADLPPDVTIVSGHNRTGSIEDLAAYLEMLVATEKVVREGVAAGLSAEELKERNVLEPWENYAGSYVSTDEWIDSLVFALGPKEEKLPSVYEPMYHGLKTGGAESAATLYQELRRKHAGDYRFTEFDLLVIGDKLLEHGKPDQALAMLELSLAEYPSSPYAYYVNYDLALAHRELGHLEEAIRCCRRALELKPEAEMVSALLEELEAAD